MNSVAIATAETSPWRLAPSDQVHYLVQLTRARAAQKWRLAYLISDVLHARSGPDYVAALEQLKAARAVGS